MLASLLFPYDDDAPELIDGWLAELEREGCIVRYQVDGQNYIEICKWLNHQKIDKPSKSKIPPFDGDSSVSREGSRIVVVGSKDQGSKDQGSKDLRGSLEPPDCPHDEIIALYHAALPTLPRVAEWTEKRKAALRSRWREKTNRQKLEWWKRYFEHVALSPFLTGNAPPQPGRKVFFADLEWLVNQSNMVKVMEGKYHPQQESA
jgi:hypothetical protein